MTERLDLRQRQGLHGADYVARYRRKSPQRLCRLVDLMTVSRRQGLQDADVVDFGCGDAVIIDYIRDKVSTYKGVDFSAEFIQVANQRKAALKACNVDFTCDSITHFGRQHRDCFDIGFSFDLSEHVYDDEWQEIVNSMYSCLRPGGRLYLHTPNADFLLEIMKKHNFLLKQFPEHIAVRNALDNCHFLAEAGFEDINAHVIPHYNIARIVHPLSLLPWVGKYFQARLFITAKKPMTV
ncbi:methyltransferase domain-containing protein [Shewanella sp. AS16]|uniref:class I SAM-dependent methyltransferase n=1 Tax=Shewanella sp. AS16 TaxID=2907625 RepID=UPI001F3E17C1|nr:class I SAM-dependent methyltransferase [Shewanella sp. AS16]MCE9685392.1 methyltransferase domain-containing protein [Shewanella sp. AS16]